MKKLLLIATTATLMAITGCKGTSTESQPETAAFSNVKLQELNDEEFAKLVGKPGDEKGSWIFASETPIVVDFYATWCGPCKKMSPNMQQLANKYKETITVYKVDVEKARQTAAMFGIQSIPTLLFVNPKTKMLSGQSGYQDYDTLEKLTKEALGVE